MQIYEYGNTGTSTNSQVTLGGTAYQWFLDKVSDRAGNTMVIAYASPSTSLVGTTVPTTISWTPNSHGSSSYQYVMTFNYSTITTPSISKYVDGSTVTNAVLLGSVTIAATGTIVKNYLLGYTAGGATGRETLTSVTECADAGGTNCLAPTMIGYQSGTAGTGTSVVLASSLPSYQQPIVADFNGDGHSDVLVKTASAWQVYFGSNTGTGSAVTTGVPTSATTVLAGDLLGKGQDGIFAAVSGVWWYYTWNGSAFSGSSTGVAVDCTDCVLSDVNGDGLPDIVGINSDNNVHTRLNTGNGSSIAFSSTSTLAYTIPIHVIAFLEATYPGGRDGHYLDFDGDHRDDVYLVYEVGAGAFYSYELISQGSTYSGTLVGNNNLPSAFIDWNDDGCTDFTYPTTIYVSPCNGAAPATITPPLAVDESIVGALDWNSDGRNDILVLNTYTNQIKVYLSTGNNAVYGGVTSLSPTGTTIAADIDGDGLDDAVTVNTASPYGVSYALHSAAGTLPDLASSFTDGYGNSSSPTYTSLARNNYSQYTDATFPDQNYIGSLNVVNQVTTSDPTNRCV